MHEAVAKKCLILAGDPGIGESIATILEHCRWQTNVVRSDLQAYNSIKHERYDTVIADIDNADLGGQALLAFCHHRYPNIDTYAIARPDDEYGMDLARKAGGCRGFYHLYGQSP
jgi:DNA-binding NtrC family response regulator